MKVKNESEVAQSYPILSDPMDCSLPGSSAHRISQARVLEWGAIAFSKIIMILKLGLVYIMKQNSSPSFENYIQSHLNVLSGMEEMTFPIFYQ